MQNPEYIITIAEEQSLLRASEKLFVTPSALSQYISRLEAELNTPLFIRSRIGWRPTAAGQLCIDLAKRIVELERQTYSQLSMVAPTYFHTISIGISPGRMTDMIADCFPHFNARFPNIKLELQENSVLDIIRQMRRQKVDIGFITSCSQRPEIGEITVHPLRSEHFVLALPSTSPLACDISRRGSFSAVSLREFESCEFMLLQHETTLRQAQDQLFENAGFTPKVIFESASSQTIHRLVQVGYAAALIPASYATPTERSVYFTVDDPLRWTLFAAHHSSHQLSDPEKHIIALAKSYYERPL